jgi:hypothetical protein
MAERQARFFRGESGQGVVAISYGVEKSQRLFFGEAMAVSKESVHLWIRCPAVTVPDFHQFAPLSGHPSSNEETANLIEVHPG